MKYLCRFLLIGVLASRLFSQESSQIRGFLSKDVSEEQTLEKQAQAVPDPGRLRRYMDFMAGEPHNAGSPRSKVVAEYIWAILKKNGVWTRTLRNSNRCCPPLLFVKWKSSDLSGLC